jgi:hypothetical protein
MVALINMFGPEAVRTATNSIELMPDYIRQSIVTPVNEAQRNFALMIVWLHGSRACAADPAMCSRLASKFAASSSPENPSPELPPSP